MPAVERGAHRADLELELAAFDLAAFQLAQLELLLPHAFLFLPPLLLPQSWTTGLLDLGEDIFAVFHSWRFLHKSLTFLQLSDFVQDAFLPSQVAAHIVSLLLERVLFQIGQVVLNRLLIQ